MSLHLKNKSACIFPANGCFLLAIIETGAPRDTLGKGGVTQDLHEDNDLEKVREWARLCLSYGFHLCVLRQGLM